MFVYLSEGGTRQLDKEDKSHLFSQNYLALHIIVLLILTNFLPDRTFLIYWQVYSKTCTQQRSLEKTLLPISPNHTGEKMTTMPNTWRHYSRWLFILPITNKNKVSCLNNIKYFLYYYLHIVSYISFLPNPKRKLKSKGKEGGMFLNECLYVIKHSWPRLCVSHQKKQFYWFLHAGSFRVQQANSRCWHVGEAHHSGPTEGQC